MSPRPGFQLMDSVLLRGSRSLATHLTQLVPSFGPSWKGKRPPQRMDKGRGLQPGLNLAITVGKPGSWCHSWTDCQTASIPYVAEMGVNGTFPKF